MLFNPAFCNNQVKIIHSVSHLRVAFFICGVYMDSATFGNVLLTIVGFLIVYTLNGIKAEIKEVKQSMNKLADELQKIDKRVVALEASK